MEDEQNTAPSAEASASEPMTFDSALNILNQADEAPVEEKPAASEASADEGPDVEADQAEAPATEQETDAAPDADLEAPEYLHGNARTRLRDGSEVTIGELKKAYDEAKEYRVKQAEFDAKRQEFEAKQAQIAAKEQHFTQTIQQAQDVLRANFPPKPDYAAVQRGELDIITFNEQQAAYNHAVEKWQALEGARKKAAEEAQQRQTKEIEARVARETQLLKDAIPELRTEEGLRAFNTELMTHAPKEYGFSQEELANLWDHRALRVLKDAIAYRKLQAEKPKAMEKAKDAPPVQVSAPGRRVSPQEQRTQVVKQQFDKLRKTGSFDDALAILNSLD